MKRTIEVKPLTTQEMHRFYKRDVFPQVMGYAARKGSMTVAIGGLAIGEDNRAWAFLDFKPGHQGGYMYKWWLRFLNELKADGIPEIWASRDRTLHTSERFLTRAGFQLTDEQIEGHEIWVWRNGVDDHGSSDT